MNLQARSHNFASRSPLSILSIQAREKIYTDQMPLLSANVLFQKTTLPLSVNLPRNPKPLLYLTSRKQLSMTVSSSSSSSSSTATTTTTPITLEAAKENTGSSTSYLFLLEIISSLETLRLIHEQLHCVFHDKCRVGRICKESVW